MIKTYSDFIQLIEDSGSKGYRVCFESSTIPMEKWAADDYLDYLDNLERHKHETGISLQYEFLCDTNNRVMNIDVFIHYPAEKDLPQRNHTMHWMVIYEK